jgi:hypothetical protein
VASLVPAQALAVLLLLLLVLVGLAVAHCCQQQQQEACCQACCWCPSAGFPTSVAALLPLQAPAAMLLLLLLLVLMLLALVGLAVAHCCQQQQQQHRAAWKEACGKSSEAVQTPLLLLLHAAARPGFPQPLPGAHLQPEAQQLLPIFPPVPCLLQQALPLLLLLLLLLLLFASADVCLSLPLLLQAPSSPACSCGHQELPGLKEAPPQKEQLLLRLLLNRAGCQLTVPLSLQLPLLLLLLLLWHQPEHLHPPKVPQSFRCAQSSHSGCPPHLTRKAQKADSAQAHGTSLPAQ